MLTVEELNKRSIYNSLDQLINSTVKRISETITTAHSMGYDHCEVSIPSVFPTNTNTSNKKSRTYVFSEIIKICERGGYKVVLAESNKNYSVKIYWKNGMSLAEESTRAKIVSDHFI